MTSDPKKSRLSCIDDFIISEILDMPDGEILAEISNTEIAEALRRFDQVKLAAGKERFEEIKAQLEREKNSGPVRSIDRAKARAELKQLIERDSELRGKLTMAARNLAGDTAEDAEGILEDLAELDDDASKTRDEK
jgi:hypothetical protein